MCRSLGLAIAIYTTYYYYNDHALLFDEDLEPSPCSQAQRRINFEFAPLIPATALARPLSSLDLSLWYYYVR